MSVTSDGGGVASGVTERSSVPSARKAPEAERPDLVVVASPARSKRAALLDAAIQILLVGALIGSYEGLRILVIGDQGEALRHANSIWSAERWLHLPNEASLQGPWVHHEWLAKLTNVWYASAHFPAISLCLLWLLLCYRNLYSRVRDVVVVATVAALAVQSLYPLAPPRMLPQHGLVDLAQKYGPSVYDSDPAKDHVANQFAAMPSLHVGYAAIVAAGVILALRTRWRWLAVLYPIGTTTAVLVTANHYWLDVAGGLLVVVLAVVVTWPLERRRRTNLHTPSGVLGDDVQTAVAGGQS